MPALIAVVGMPDPLLRAENEDCSRHLRLCGDGSSRLTRAVSEEAAAFELEARFGHAVSWVWLEHGCEQA